MTDLLRQLPAYMGKARLISARQDVYDIVKEILRAHKQFAGDYDRIALYFDGNSTREICAKLLRFCRENIRYETEPETRQTTKSPGAILSEGKGDCKHYASFIGGVLDALNRRGKKIEWLYRFASYSITNTEPEHIFVVVKSNGKEIWVDPTPGAESVTPVWQINKRVKADNMALYRISGIGEVGFLETDYTPSTPLDYAIILLMRYGVLNDRAQVDDKRLADLQKIVTPEQFETIIEARRIIQAAAGVNAVGSIFSKLFQAVKAVGLAAPRAAFLSLVKVNAFHYGYKLYNAIYNKDGSYTSFKDRLRKIWEKLGGKFSVLERTIRQGAAKDKRISGAVPVAAAAAGGVSPATIAAWAAAAGAVVVAIMPLVKAFIDKKQKEQPLDIPIQDNGGDGGNGGGMKVSPALLIGGAAAAYLLMRKK